jgi:hypothetical protein
LVKPDHGIALHLAGVGPAELGWHYEDNGELTIGGRLFMGQMTVEQAVFEVEGRRQRE